MAYHLIKSMAEGIGENAFFGGGRVFFDATGGKTRYNGLAGQWRDKNGDVTALNPIQKRMRRANAKGKEVLTGKKYNPMTGKQDGDGSRIGAAGSLIGGALVSPVTGTMLAAGWGARTAAGLGFMASKPITRAAGHATYQGAMYTGETVIGAAKTIHKMNKSPIGREALFYGGAVGAAGVGGASMLSNSTGLTKDKLALYANQSIDSVPGTMSSQGAGTPSRGMVDTGADGDLVLAMHTLR